MTPIPRPDEVVIRTDDGIIKAEVTEMAQHRPEDGARLGGTLDADEPKIHFVDYHRSDEG